MSKVQGLDFELDENLFNKLNEAVNLAEKTIRRGVPLAPFIITDSSLGMFAVGDSHESFRAALNQFPNKVRTESNAVLVYDAYLNPSEQTGDAIFMQTYQDGFDGWIIIAQPYRPRRLFRTYQRLGQLQLVRLEPWYSDSDKSN